MGRYFRHCNHDLYTLLLSIIKFGTCVVTFIIKQSKVSFAQYGFCPSYHVAHSFAVVLVGYLKIYGDVMFTIYGSLYVVSYLGNVVSGDKLTAVWIGCGNLHLAAFFQVFFVMLIFTLLLLMFLYFL